ncbi:NACHT-domain-containing protein [Thozetella sp. PMI_491]|nr:NACHT-domain-containing protein [Thozetella sp. PMI_491]
MVEEGPDLVSSRIQCDENKNGRRDPRAEQCIRDLRVTDPRDDKSRIEHTKGGLLEDSYRWIFNNPDFRRWRDDENTRMLWIKGEPGKGKTMLLCGIVDQLRLTTKLATPEASTLLSYFFCQATDSRINSATAVLRGLIYLLVEQQPSLVSHIQEKYNHAEKALFEDKNACFALSGILKNILQDPGLQNTWLIVDALDECVTELPPLLDLIIRTNSPRVKWVISSRNLPQIEEKLYLTGQTLSLELNAESVSAAVDTYIRHKVLQLAQQKKYSAEIQNAVQHHLSSNANGTFLWVALVCQNLHKIPLLDTLTRLQDFPPGLDSLYERMIQQIYPSEFCKQILALMASVYRPVTLEELKSFVSLPYGIPDNLESWTEAIGLCGSFLTCRDNTIYFIHQSAKDFLIAEASNDIFPSGIEEIHHNVFSRSLQAMSVLRRDIYTLKAPGFPIEQVKEPDPEQPDKDPLATVGYSCVYWIDHLHESGSENIKKNLQDDGAIDKLLYAKFLYWLEALSLLKSISHSA